MRKIALRTTIWPWTAIGDGPVTGYFYLFHILVKAKFSFVVLTQVAINNITCLSVLCGWSSVGLSIRRLQD